MPKIALKTLENMLRAKKLDGTVLHPWLDDVTFPAAPTGIPSLDEAHAAIVFCVSHPKEAYL